MNKVKLQGFILIVLMFFLPSNVFGQYKEAARFSIADGLPSNHLYTCIEDNHGFLWIATDAGIARFDGKYFQVFTTDQGLPDNDVIQVVKEKNGRIWVNCFNQSPSYFDEVKNRFISAEENMELAKVKGNRLSLIYPLPSNGVIFKSNQIQFLLLNNSVYEISKYSDILKNTNILKIYSDGSILTLGNPNFQTDPVYYFYHTLNGKNIEKKTSGMNSSVVKQLVIDFKNSEVYFCDEAKSSIFRLSSIGIDPLRFQLDSLPLRKYMTYYDLVGNYFAVTNMDAEIDVYHKDTLKYLFTIKGNYKANALCIDQQENHWLTTIDKGIVLYKKMNIIGAYLPEKYEHESFLSIAKRMNGNLLLGNYAGMVLEANAEKSNMYKIHLNDKRHSWQRAIICSQHKTFIFSEKGIFSNYGKELIISKQGSKVSSLKALKAAIPFNDTMLITGGMLGLYKINSVTETVQLLLSSIRATSLATIDHKDIIYFGSTDGLYKYSLQKETTVAVKKSNSLLNEHIVSLCTTPDSLLWIATANKGIVALKNDRVIIHITKAKGLTTNNSITIMNGKNGQVWVGSNEGISIINYTYSSSFALHKIQNLSVRDGLTSNVINQMFYQNDTMYAATNNGVSIIPASISIPVFDIPISITKLEINQRDTSLASHYKLKSFQNNIGIRFAGVELTGHFKHAEYSLDKGLTWAKVEGNNLNLQLNSGEHHTWLRAIDVNGNKGTRILKLQFDIATPYHKTWWFQLLIWSAISILLLFVVYSFARKERKQIQLQKELAVSRHQTQSASINPHFIFNALNSVQHFMNLNDRLSANRYLTSFAKLIRKNFNATKSLDISLSDEIESLQLYLNLERMRQPDQFTYEIEVDESLEAEDIKLPVMILQPFVENAILHGFSKSTIAGKLCISFRRVEINQLEILISDNGIGTHPDGLSDPDHQSSGQQITQSRIELYAKIKGYEAHIENYPLQPENKENPGHVVRIMLPISVSL